MAKRKPKTKKSKLDRAAVVSPKPVLEGPSGREANEQLFNFSPGGTRVFLCLVLGLIVAFVFFPVLGNSLVKWDDDITVYHNPHVQGLDLERLQWMFTDVRYSMRYKPLAWLSVALIYSISGLKPFTYHLVSLLLHSANAVLVFLVFRQLMARKGIELISPMRLSIFAALGALFWALHPLRAEVVARVTDMAYCQSTFFVLISLWCYLRWIQLEDRRRTEQKWYWFSVVSFALAMGTYPLVFAYPVVLLVLDVYLLRRLGANKSRGHSMAKRIWLEKVPFLLLSCLVLVTFLGRLNPTGIWTDQTLEGQYNWSLHCMQAFYVWAYFAWKPFLPFNLSPLYTTLVSFHPTDWLFVGSGLFVVGLTVLLFWKRRQWPMAWTLWICHLLFLIPALGLTESPHYATDRYSYVPGIALSALLVGVLWQLCRYAKRYVWPVVAAGILIASLGTLSARQIRVWHDTVTLFQYVLANLGDDPYRIDLIGRLGDYYVEIGKLDEAVVTYRQLIPLMPDNSNLRNNLGILLMRGNRYDEAVPELKEAIRLDPRAAGLRKNLGDLYTRMERYDDAVAEYEEGLRLKSDDAETQNNLGLALMKKGEVTKAINHFQEAAKLQPQHPQIHANLENALRSLNQTPANSSNP